MQKILFKIIILILTVSSLDTYAQNKCSDLFSQNEYFNSQFLTNKAPAEYVGMISLSVSIASKIKDLYSAKQKTILTEQLIVAIHKQFNDEYIPAISNILAKQNIKHKIIFKNDGPEEHLKNLSYPVFIIEPDQSSKLNIYASGLHKKTGVSLMYSPVFNHAMNFSSAFIPDMNAIALHDHAILENKFSDSKITPHEIKHVLFHAERKGIFKPKIKSPTHGFITNKKFVHQDSRKPYQSFLSFEELVTYSYSLSAEAKDILRSVPLDNQSTYKKYLDVIQDISKRCSDISKISIMQIDQLAWSVIDYDNALTIKISDDESVTLLVPKDALVEFQKNPFAYAKNEFLKISQLADFNLQYLQNMNLTNNVENAANFRSAQVQFLENLNK